MHRYYASLFKALQGYIRFIRLLKQAHISVRQSNNSVTKLSPLFPTHYSHHHRATCAEDRVNTQVTAQTSSSCSVVQENRRRTRTVWMPGLPSSPHQQVSSPSPGQRRDPHSSLGVGGISVPWASWSVSNGEDSWVTNSTFRHCGF